MTPIFKKALIPAAGRGLRSYPKNKHLPKGLFEIANRPILENTISILRNQMGIEDISIIVGHLKNQIQDYFSDGKKWNVNLSYMECPNPDIGLAQGLLLAEKTFKEPFVCILGDEYYSESNHQELPALTKDTFAVCGIKRSDDIKEIKKNYSVVIQENDIRQIIEKPEYITQWYLGCGTYVFHPEIFDWIKKTPLSTRTKRVELMDTLAYAIDQGKKVTPFFLKGHYFNINSVEDINQCNYTIRSKDFDQKKISLIIPTRNEEKTIAHVIRDAKSHVDEILVIDNQSTDQTAAVSEAEGAIVHKVNLKGYGDTICYGLDKASGEILIVVEADYTFRAKDLGKFLEYIKDADMVIGTRTTRQLIEQGANMKGWLRLGNLIYAKFVEMLWWENEPRFTDVGCTYRAIWKGAYKKIRNDLHSTGPEFSLEMMIKMLQYRQRILEIPISYYPRLDGQSKHSQNWRGIFRTAFRMLCLIVKERIWN